jgi:hypothetical protein
MMRRRQNCSLKGLSAQLREHLILFCEPTFNTLVSAAIDQKGASHSSMDTEKMKRKRVMPGPSGGAPPKYHLVYASPTRQQQMSPRAPTYPQ